MDKHGKIHIVIGCVLAAASVFAAASILSYHGTDPGGGDFTGSVRVANWCGAVGAYFSGFLIRNFGRPAAFFGVALMVFWVGLLFTAKERLADAYLKIAGSVIFVLSISALSALAGRGRYFFSVVGSLFADRAVLYFGDLGACVFVLLITILSLLLATDFMVVAPVGRACLAVLRLGRSGVAKLFVAVRSRRKKAGYVPVGRIPRGDTTESVFPTRRPTEAEGEAPQPKKTLPIMPVSELNRATSEPEAPAAADAEVAAQPKLPFPAVDAPRSSRKSGAQHKAETGYVFPQASLLDEERPEDGSLEDDYIQEKAKVLEDTLAEFGLSVKVIGIEPGPVITQYELELAPGIKVSRVISLSDDIAMALKAPSVRIVAPIPGRDSVGVEVPNTKKTIVRLRGLLGERPPDKIGIIPVYLGRDAQGEPLVADLTEMPHLLIAGATGAGKSVCINSVILSILMSQHPDDVKLLLVDPKMVELSAYKDMPHLVCPVVTDMKKAATILEWACVQMDSRYDFLSAANVRHISRYNKLGPKGLRDRLGVPHDAEVEIPDKMPYIIIIIDELADLMMVAAKDIETSITRLAQKSRAVGLHLVLATQRPSVDVITGLIKSNLPVRLSFKVSSKIDSRTILDQNGAEKLLGRGDMLFSPPATAKLVRAQGTYVSDEEIRRVVDFAKDQRRPDYDDELVDWKKADSDERGPGAGEGAAAEEGSDDDPLYDQAVQVVIENQRGSVSLLQRRLEIGYSRAARLIDVMAERAILGPYKGSQAREVLFTVEQWDEMHKELKGRSR